MTLYEWLLASLNAFDQLLRSMDAVDDPAARRRRAFAFLARAAQRLQAAPTLDDDSFFFSTCMTLGSSCWLLGIAPSPAAWRRALLDIVVGDIQSHAPTMYVLVATNTPPAYRDGLVNALTNAGVLRAPGSRGYALAGIDDQALRVAIHLAMRLLISLARVAPTGPEDPARTSFRGIVGHEIHALQAPA